MASFTRSERKLEGFLNLKTLIDNKWWTIEKGSALYPDNDTASMILAKVEEDPDFEFLVKGSVFLMASKAVTDPKKAKFEKFDFDALTATVEPKTEPVIVAKEEIPF
jgi:hypothetical protein